MTLNYWMIVERHPKPNEDVDMSIPNCEIFYVLDGEKLAKMFAHATLGLYNRSLPILCVPTLLTKPRLGLDIYYLMPPPHLTLAKPKTWF